MAQVTFAAEPREHTGKGAARAARRAGRVPGIIYGTKQEPVLISVDPRALMDKLDAPGFYSHVFEIEIGGKKHRTLAREVQFDPVTDRPIHIDFMRFGPDTRVDVEVPVRFRNHAEAPGLKRGGVLNVVRHTIELRCRPDHIPEHIMCDLTGLDIGDSLHIDVIELPADVERVIKRNFTVATITAPTILIEVEETPAEGEGVLAEGEVAAEGVVGAEGEAVEGAPAEGEGTEEAGVKSAPGAAPPADKGKGRGDR
jgi:large subunit ribosomal protein L25